MYYLGKGPLLPQLSSACVLPATQDQEFLSLFISWPHPCPNLEHLAASLQADPAESLEQAGRWGTLQSSTLCVSTQSMLSSKLCFPGVGLANIQWATRIRF